MKTDTDAEAEETKEKNEKKKQKEEGRKTRDARHVSREIVSINNRAYVLIYVY